MVTEPRTREDVDAFKTRCDKLAPIPDESWRFMDSHRFAPAPPPEDLDPHGPEYREWVMEQYASMAGKPYELANEGHAFGEEVIRTPWP